MPAGQGSKLEPSKKKVAITDEVDAEKSPAMQPRGSCGLEEGSWVGSSSLVSAAAVSSIFLPQIKMPWLCFTELLYVNCADRWIAGGPLVWMGWAGRDACKAPMARGSG